jgi:ATP-dependent helicase/nuclease subunit A
MSIVPVDHEMRERLTSCFDRNFIVEASAGSGKTTVLVERLVQMLASGACKVNELAALTFTRKAAGEMRSRFFVRLEAARFASDDERVRQRLTQSLDQVHQAYIGTIHGFCARLLREYATEAGLPISFTEVEAEEERELLNELWDAWLLTLMEKNDPIVVELQKLGLQLNDLREGFARFLQYSDVPEWPVTRVKMPDTRGLESRLKEYLDDMAKLAPRLPAEVDDRLMQKYRRLPRLAATIRWNEPHQALRHLEEYDIINGGVVKKRWPNGPKQCDAELERWNTFCETVSLPLLEQWRAYRYPAVMQFLQRTEKHYTQERLRRGMLTYQDLLGSSVQLLRQNAMVRRQLGQQWKRLLIDEFQDTDPLQAEFLFLLTAQRSTSKWLQASPRPGSLMLVGDPKQSIYRFRRADIHVYDLVKQRIEATGGELIQLTVNFRSQPMLVEWINDSFAKEFSRSSEGTQVDYTNMEPGREATNSLSQCLQYLELHEDETGRTMEEVTCSEAELIARFIQEATEGKLTFERSAAEEKRGVPATAVADDFMILTHKRDRLQIYGETLHRWGIPNQVTGGAQLNIFPGLRLLYLLLKSVCYPNDPVPLVGLLRSELCGMSDKQLYVYRSAGGTFDWTMLPETTLPQSAPVITLFSQLQALANDLQRLPVAGAVERAVLAFGLPLWSHAWNTELGLASFAKAMICISDAASRTDSLQGVLRQIERLLKRDPRRDGLYLPSQEGVGVRIMNLHKAKGLEARVVILTDTLSDFSRNSDETLHVEREEESSRGYLHVKRSLGQYVQQSVAHPHEWKKYAERERLLIEAEKQRLLYVAATRAKEMLVVCYRTARDGDANRANPWRDLIAHLGGATRLEPDFDRQPKPAEEKTVERAESTESLQSLDLAWKACLSPTAQVPHGSDGISEKPALTAAEMWHL